MEIHESVVSLEGRIATATSAAAVAPDAAAEVKACEAELVRIEDVEGQGVQFQQSLRQFLGRPNVITSVAGGPEIVRAVLNDLDNRRTTIMRSMGEARERVAAGAILDNLKLQLANAEERDARLSGGIFAAVGIGRRFGQPANKAANVAAYIDFIKTVLFAKSTGFATQQEVLSQANSEQWSKTASDLARWKEENEVVYAGVRHVRVGFKNETRECATVYRLVQSFERGAWCWRIHQAAMCLFTPFAADDVTSQLRKLGVQVQGALLADNAFLINEDGSLSVTIQHLPEYFE